MLPLGAEASAEASGLAGSRARAASPYDGLLKDVPNETNVILLLNPERAYASALAKRENWMQQWMDRNRAGVAMLGDTGQGEWRVAVPEGWTNLAFFRHAGSAGVVIRSLVRDDETLEELFLRTVGA